MKRDVQLAGVILGVLALAAAADERVRPTREQADAIRVTVESWAFLRDTSR